jgi:hypothetical protein
VLLLTTASAKDWCLQHRFVIEERNRRFSVGFGESDSRRFRVRIPASGRRSVGLAYVLLMSEVRDDREDAFAGGLIWLTDWDIGSETFEQVGMALLQGLRGGELTSRNILGQSAHLFGKSELPLANALLTLPLVFLWDAWFLPAGGNWLARISNDGYVEMQAETEECLTRLEERFIQGGWVGT